MAAAPPPPAGADPLLDAGAPPLSAAAGAPPLGAGAALPDASAGARAPLHGAARAAGAHTARALAAGAQAQQAARDTEALARVPDADAANPPACVVAAAHLLIAAAGTAPLTNDVHAAAAFLPPPPPNSALATALAAAHAAAAEGHARLRVAALAWERKHDEVDALARQIAEAEQLLILPTSHDVRATSSDSGNAAVAAMAAAVAARLGMPRADAAAAVFTAPPPPNSALAAALVADRAAAAAGRLSSPLAPPSELRGLGGRGSHCRRRGGHGGSHSAPLWPSPPCVSPGPVGWHRRPRHLSATRGRPCGATAGQPPSPRRYRRLCLRHSSSTCAGHGHRRSARASRGHHA